MANLLYAYNFNEASGNILDVSGHGRDVVFGGSLNRVAGGHTGKGMSQTAAVTDSAGPALAGLQTPECSLMMWIKRTDNSVVGWAGELKSSGSGDRGILLGLSGNTSFRCRNSGGTAATPGVAQPAINTWYHAAGTYNVTDALVRLFMNGVQAASAALTGPLKTTSTSSSLFDTLGAETIIDEVRYYDGPLTAAEISTLMGTEPSAGVSLTLAQIQEHALARPLSRAKARALAQQVERAQLVPLSQRKVASLHLATESALALPLSPRKARALGLAPSTQQVLPLSPAKARALTAMQDRAVVLAVAPQKVSGFAQVTERSVMFQLTSSLAVVYVLAQIHEGSALQELSPLKIQQLGAVIEHNTALGLVMTGSGPRLVIYRNGTQVDVTNLAVARAGVAVPVDKVEVAGA